MWRTDSSAIALNWAGAPVISFRSLLASSMMVMKSVIPKPKSIEATDVMEKRV